MAESSGLNRKNLNKHRLAAVEGFNPNLEPASPALARAKEDEARAKCRERKERRKREAGKT